MKHTHEDPTPYMYDTLQLLFLTTHYKTKTNDYVDDFPLYKIPAYIIKKRNKNHDHDKCLY